MSELLSQGGYAFYVWSSYGMALALLLLELIQLRRRRRTILLRISRFILVQIGRGKT